MRIKYPLSNRQNTEKGMNNGDNNRHREEVCGPPILTLGLGVAEVLENCHILCLVVPHAIVCQKPHILRVSSTDLETS